MGGGARYPFPKEIWSPTGGWWSRPSNWKQNTFVCGLVLAGFSTIIWRWSAANEKRLAAPTKPIPSRYWSQPARDAGIRIE